MSLKRPPCDAKGEVLPHDHDEILPEDGIIRRISHQQIVFDKKVNGQRISSLAFNPPGGMSVDLQRQIEEAGLNSRQYVTTPRWIGSLRFEAGPVRAIGFQVGFDPLLTNPYHGEIWGNFKDRKNQRKLRKVSEWFVQIPGIAIGEE